MSRKFSAIIVICISGLFACTEREEAGASIDHIIVAINNLDSGVNQIKRLTGIEPVYGGSHPDSNTSNALFSVGEHTYIEILAPRSGLDTIQEYFKQFDQLTPIGWAVSAKEIEMAVKNIQVAGIKSSVIQPGSRVTPSGDTLRWKIFTIDGQSESTMPFLINWSSSAIHPAQSSAKGCTLKRLTLRSQKADVIKQILDVLDFSDNRVLIEPHHSDHLEFVLETPKGEVILSVDGPRNTKNASVSIKHAQHFSVSYRDNYKIVKTHATIRRWGSEEAQVVRDVMVLYQRGTEPPVLAGELVGASLIEIPVNRIATNLESTERFLEELGVQQKIQAVGGLISFNDSIRNAVAQGKIGQIGYSWHQPPNQEVLLERKIELFLMTLSNLDFKDALTKCRQLGVSTATVFDWAESNYLAQAEWIKFFALFVNEEEKADRIFNKIVIHVQEIKQMVALYPERPTAIWGYYTGKGRWLVHHNGIEAQLLKDAGLVNVFYDSTRAVRNEGEALSTEQLIEKAKDVTHWIIGDIHSGELPREIIMSAFSAWRSGSLYHNMKRSKPEANAFDWYGSAPVRPDYVLADLVKLLRPDIKLDHKTVFMDRFDKQFKFPIEEGAF